jgi:hypothetical protein
VETLTLHCETITNQGELFYVQLPVTLELWGTEEHPAREHLRARARAELRYAVTSRGRRPLAGRSFDDAPVWIEYPGQCTVECVGGPLDGLRVTTPGDNAPPPLLRLARPLDWSVARADQGLQGTETMRMSTYSPMTNEHGFFARAADGAWRFQHRR